MEAKEGLQKTFTERDKLQIIKISSESDIHLQIKDSNHNVTAESHNNNTLTSPAINPRKRSRRPSFKGFVNLE